MYMVALAMYDIGANRTWTKYDLETDDGYQVSLVRIYGDVNGNILGDDFGPVLMLHGMYTDGLAWFGVEDKFLAGVPTRLFDEGYDVWIGFKRGSFYARNHSNPDFVADYDAFNPMPS